MAAEPNLNSSMVGGGFIVSGAGIVSSAGIKHRIEHGKGLLETAVESKAKEQSDHVAKILELNAIEKQELRNAMTSVISTFVANQSEGETLNEEQFLNSLQGLLRTDTSLYPKVQKYTALVKRINSKKMEDGFKSKFSQVDSSNMRKLYPGLVKDFVTDLKSMPNVRPELKEAIERLERAQSLL